MIFISYQLHYNDLIHGWSKAALLLYLPVWKFLFFTCLPLTTQSYEIWNSHSGHPILFVCQLVQSSHYFFPKSKGPFKGPSVLLFKNNRVVKDTKVDGQIWKAIWKETSKTKDIKTELFMQENVMFFVYARNNLCRIVYARKVEDGYETMVMNNSIRPFSSTSIKQRKRERFCYLQHFSWTEICSILAILCQMCALHFMKERWSGYMYIFSCICIWYLFCWKCYEKGITK